MAAGWNCASPPRFPRPRQWRTRPPLRRADCQIHLRNRCENLPPVHVEAFRALFCIACWQTTLRTFLFVHAQDLFGSTLLMQPLLRPIHQEIPRAVTRWLLRRPENWERIRRGIAGPSLRGPSPYPRGTDARRHTPCAPAAGRPVGRDKSYQTPCAPAAAEQQFVGETPN